MKLRKLIIINALIFLSILFAMLINILVVDYYVDQSVEENTKLNDVSRDVVDLTILFNSYLSEPLPRKEETLTREFANLHDQLTYVHPNFALSSVEASSLPQTFEKLSKELNKDNPENIIIQTLANEISIRLQSILSTADNIIDASNQELIQVRNRTLYISLGINTLGLVFTLIFFQKAMRTFTKFLRQLSHQFQSIKNKDFSARLNKSNKGIFEFQKIKSELNSMTQNQYNLVLGLENALRESKQMESIISNLNIQLEQNIRNTLRLLNKTLEANDLETGNHGERVKILAMKLGQQMNLSIEDLDNLEFGAAIHDIGKIGVDSTILKSTNLSDEKYKIIQTHCTIGKEIFDEMPHMSSIQDIIYSHHEYYNGQGYPRGLKGEQIPILARIVSVVDAFDAMTTSRVYKRTKSKDQAIEELLRCSGSQFDPNIVECFINLLNKNPEASEELSYQS